MEKDLKIFIRYIEKGKSDENKSDSDIKLITYLSLIIFCGLKFKTINKLRWLDLINKRHLNIDNITIEIPKYVHEILLLAYDSLSPNNDNEVILNYSSQYLGRKIKDIYGSNYSTIELRKLFGYRILKLNNYSYKSLLYLTRFYHNKNPIDLINYLKCTYEYNNNVSILINDSIVDITSKIDDDEQNKNGYLYFIRIKGKNIYKIGISNDYSQRILSIDSYLPYEIETILIIELENNKILEKKLHLKYAKQNLRKEWFTLSDKDVNDIKKIIMEG